MKHFVLPLVLFLAAPLAAQKTSSTDVKMDFLHLPTLPMSGVDQVGIEVYTADLPFNRDTLRHYLGNMDVLKSGGERLSKIKFEALTETDIVGGTGDITIRMALGKPFEGNKELLDAACMIAKDGCKQYYYKVDYRLPAVVQAVKGGEVLDTWELDPAMQLQFGNEQVETQSRTAEGSTTTIRVVSFNSQEALDKAYDVQGGYWLARKAALVQLGRMIESVYPRLFFLKDELKFDLTYGKGDAADYSETEQASVQAANALMTGDYKALASPIATWEKWLERTDASDKKAAVNANVAEGLHENMAIACAFAGDYAKAHSNLDQSLKFAQQGMVNVNKVDRLKAFHGFIDDLEKGRASNGSANTASLVEAPDIKKLLGRRKFNEDIDFLIAQDKYAEFSGSMTSTSEQNAGEATLESALGAMLASGGGSYESRVNNGMLILNSIFDRDLNGQPLPESICGMSGLTTLNARNMGLTGVPACIGQLTGLDKLYLDGNAITELPESLGQLTGLTLLDISDNQLTSLPEGIYQLKNLKKLTVSGNQLSPEVMAKLAERLPDCKIK